MLILGGTREAVDLATRLNAEQGLEVITSFAGVTRNPRLPQGETRSGGYGGADGLATYLREEGVAAVVDATHPYAASISLNAADAGKATGVPVLHLTRPAWEMRDGDVWQLAGGPAEAAAWLNASALPDGAGVLLTTGRSDLAAYRAVRRLRLIARVVETPNPECREMLDRLIQDRGPFTLDAERRLMIDNQVACLVSKNSGGTASYPKIEAARELGLPVVMIRRPAPPPGLCVPSVADVASWLENLA